MEKCRGAVAHPESPIRIWAEVGEGRVLGACDL